MAPVHRRAQGALLGQRGPGSAGQHGVGRDQPLRDFAGRQHSQPRGGELERQGEPVEAWQIRATASALSRATGRRPRRRRGTAFTVTVGISGVTALNDGTTPEQARQLGIDALDAYAARMARRPPQEWPDALLLLGDQVYADELTPQNRRRIAGRRDRHPDWPDDEIVSYDEYVGLYRDSWADPEVRWLMSCVPTAMIFDDHDVHDDWNTSQAWRQQMAQKPWWRERIRSALASYWVYQHLGNLPAEELAADPDYRRILDAEGDTWPLLVELADRADAEVDGSKGLRFSFRWDLGTSRFIMIDSRNGRILDDGRHLMLGDREFGWVEEQMRDGAVDHLVLGTSLPWLLPHALGDLQAVNQIAANRPGWRGWLAEKIRQGADLEHWQAFHDSFDRLTRLIARVATGDPGERPPATVSVLSGDVHHSYAARVDLPGITGTERGPTALPASTS